MHEECIRRIKEIAGKLVITEEDLKTIEQNATLALREISQEDGFKTSHPSYKVKAVSDRAKDLHLSGKLAFAETMDRVVNAPPDKQFEVFLSSLRGEHGNSLEGAIAGAKGEVYKHFGDFHNLGSKYLGFANDHTVMEKVYKAVRGVETDDKAVNSFAQTVRKVYGNLVKQAKQVGLEFNELEFFSPQPHDRIKIGRLSADEFVQITKNRLDIKSYEQQGLSGKKLDNFLKESYFTLSSGGGNKVIESQGRLKAHHPSIGGSRRNPRQLHFTPEGYSEHMKQFGANVTPSEFIARSFDALIRDIEVTRRFGTNAHDNFNWMLETVKKNARDFYREELKGESGKKWQSAHDNIESDAQSLKTYWDRLTISRELLADDLSTLQKGVMEAQATSLTFDIARVFGKQVIATIPEMIRTVVLGTQRTGMSMGKTLREALKLATDAEHRAFVKSVAPAWEHAISGMMDEVSGGAFGVNRVLADKAVKVQWLKALDTFHTRFISASLMSHMGEVAKDFKDFKYFKQQFGDQTYRTLVKDYGFTETDFKILKKVESKGYITAESIRNLNHPTLDGFAKAEGKSVELLKDTLASKYNTMIWGLTQEQARGSMHSSLQDTKYLSSRGGYPLLRFTSQFLITPLSILRQHLWTVPHHHIEGFVSAQWYRAKFIALGIVLENIFTTAVKTMIKGEEHPDYTDPSYLAEMTLKALIHYDRFSSPYKTAWEGLARGVAGPALSNIADLAISGFKWITSDEEKPEKVEKARDNLTKQISRQIPLQNLWQLQLAQNVFQYNVLDNVFDILNPGYKERLEIRKEQNELKYSK
ncbi:hypothetical protein AP064_05525 [Candidatus Liberibacter solanacearum]|uniref:Uncharacterized protein n=1 Tax=Candidatus Liberibacter solanacearum TaxID=556287 RepID=A0A0F4VJF0_9HYPH|nr:hypothetical protein [Candidatus Liberibacter solanacearum]KJZ81581.1 hypothetical protein DJ66_0303 [Candidatus Liberibacter solanacearum]KQC48679.1 hypothetical protein AP064_05525 [Candidatus Liberibacter solanacearum]